MISIDVLNMRQRTHRALLSKLTKEQAERLHYFRIKVTQTVYEAVSMGKWSVDMRCDESAIAEIIVAELRMKGFIAHTNICYRNSMAKSDPYYELQIDWEIGD